MLIRSTEALQAVRDDWDALAARHGSPLLEHDWQMACAAALHDERDLHVVAVRDNGRLVAAAPLAVDRRRRRLALLGAAALYEPSGCLFASDAAADALALELIRCRQPSVFERVPHDGPFVHAVRRNAGGRAITIDRPAGSSNVVEVRGSWADFLAGLSSRTRRGLERQRAALAAAAGAVDVTVDTPSPDAVAGVLERLARIEATGWKGRRGSSLADRADLRGFFLAYGERAAGRGRLRVSTLMAGSTAVAMELAVVAHRRIWGLKLAYVEALAAHGPGLQLVHTSIQAAFEQGLEGYEFLGSSEAWQDRWHPERRDHGVLALYPVSVRGLVRAAADLRSSLVRRLAGAAGVQR